MSKKAKLNNLDGQVNIDKFKVTAFLHFTLLFKESSYIEFWIDMTIKTIRYRGTDGQTLVTEQLSI